jgi:hypothetical protein
MTTSRLVLALAASLATASGCALEVEDVEPGQESLETGPAETKKAVYEQVTIDESNNVTRKLFDSDGNPVDASAAPLAECPVLPSFFDSCAWPKGFHRNVDTCVVDSAYSDSCQRWDGSWGGYTYLTNPCQGDVSNCNGFIVCASGGC